MEYIVHGSKYYAPKLVNFLQNNHCLFLDQNLWSYCSLQGFILTLSLLIPAVTWVEHKPIFNGETWLQFQ